MAAVSEHHEISEKTPSQALASLEHHIAELFRADIKTNPGHENTGGSEKPAGSEKPVGSAKPASLSGPEKPPAGDRSSGLLKDTAGGLSGLVFDNKIYGGSFDKNTPAGLPADKRPPEQKMLDPNVSYDHKIAIADLMYQSGQRSFKGSDGKNYEIKESDLNGKKLVGLFTNDEHGHSHPVLRGSVEKDGHVSKQTNSRGQAVDFESNWAKNHAGVGLGKGSDDKDDKYVAPHDGSNVVGKSNGGAADGQGNPPPDSSIVKNGNPVHSVAKPDANGARTNISNDGKTVAHDNRGDQPGNHGAGNGKDEHKPDSDRDKGGDKTAEAVKGLSTSGQSQVVLTPERFAEVGKQDLLKINPDGSPVTKDQLAAALQDPKFKGEQAQALAAMYKSFDQLHNLSNHEWFFSSKSITAGDLDKFPQVAKQQEALVQKSWGDKWWADSNFNKFADSHGYIKDSDIAKDLNDPKLSADDRAHLQDMQQLIAERGHSSQSFGEKGVTKADIEAKAKEVWTGTDTAKLNSSIESALNRTVESQNNDGGEDKLYHTQNPLDSITPDAIKQGTVGDCYFESAVAAVAANRPELIRDMIHDNKDGTYTVTFPGAKDTPIKVKAPTEAEQGLYNGGTRNGTWASVLEKAYGQYEMNKRWFSGGEDIQEAIGHGGWPAQSMELLTGAKSTTTSVSDKSNTHDLANKFQAAFSAHPPKPVTAVAPCDSGGSDLAQTPDGVYKNHAYTVLGFTPDGHGGGTVKVLNPWGNNDDHGGTFEMPLSKFIKNFQQIDVNG